MPIVEETWTKSHPISRSFLYLKVFGAEFMVFEADDGGEADVIETVRKKGRFTNYLVAKVQMQDGQWWIESPQRWSARGREREPSIGVDALKRALEEVDIADWMTGKTVPRFEPKGHKSIVVRRHGHFNMLRDLERRTDALRKSLAKTDLSWNPKLQKQLQALLRRSEKTVSKFHDAELKHRIHGGGAMLSFPSIPKTAKLIDELAGAGLLFTGDPLGALPLVAMANRKGRRAKYEPFQKYDEPRNPQDALVLALVLALTAPSDSDSEEAMRMAQGIISHFRISERAVQRAQASAEMIVTIESLQVEGKSVEDLIRAGVVVPAVAGIVGEANKRRGNNPFRMPGRRGINRKHPFWRVERSKKEVRAGMMKHLAASYRDDPEGLAEDVTIYWERQPALESDAVAAAREAAWEERDHKRKREGKTKRRPQREDQIARFKLRRQKKAMDRWMRAVMAGDIPAVGEANRSNTAATEAQWRARLDAIRRHWERQGQRAKSRMPPAPRSKDWPWTDPPSRIGADCKWVSSSKPPTKDGDYLGYVPDQDPRDRVWIVGFHKGMWTDVEGVSPLTVTHWTKMPGKPVARGRANEAVRYLYVEGTWDHRPPPKTWAKKEASYYSRRLARKAKAVGSKAWQDYLRLRGVWLFVKVRGTASLTADSARNLLERALNGSELASSNITVLADPFDLTKGTPLRGPKYGQPVGVLPARLKPELPAPRFTIGRTEKTPSGWERVERDKGAEIDPAGPVDPQALWMGFYNVPGSHDLEGLPGMRFFVTHSSPFSIQSVSTDSIGFAHIPVVKVTALAKDIHNFGADVARPLAVAFAKDQGVVFDLYYPTRGVRRSRVTTDRNPASASYGKNKKMEEVEITFEIPQEQLKRLPREKQQAFTSPWSHSLRWGRDKIDHWLGLDKVEVLAAYRAKKGKK